MKSQYYDDFDSMMEKYAIPPEAYEFAGGDFAMTEEMFFNFTIYLVM